MLKDIIKELKRQPKEWEKIFANPRSDKHLKFNVFKELLKLNKKTNNGQRT